MEAPRWYGIISNPRCEKRAALSIMDALRPRDVNHELAVYLPVETYFAYHARKKEIRTRPLLVSYVFVFIRPDDMHIVRGCDGVMDFVRGPGGLPAPLIARELHKLRDREEGGEFDATRAEDFGGIFKEGEAIKVAAGKFADVPGRVVRMTAADKVRVVLSMFGKDHEREYRVADLKAA